MATSTMHILWKTMGKGKKKKNFMFQSISAYSDDIDLTSMWLVCLVVCPGLQSSPGVHRIPGSSGADGGRLLADGVGARQHHHHHAHQCGGAGQGTVG